MKIQTLNIYTNNLKKQPSLTFCKVDKKENNLEKPWHVEERKLFDEYCRKSNALSRKYECGDISWDWYILERETIGRWFTEQKNAIIEKYNNIAKNNIHRKPLKKIK